MIVGVGVAAAQDAPTQDTSPSDSAAAEDPELAAWDALLEDALAAWEEKDYAGGRSRITAAIDRVLGEIGLREDEAALEVLERMGRLAHELGNLDSAAKARRHVLEMRSRTLPDNHPDLQRARANLALTVKALGDLMGARALQEKVIEVFTATLPDDDPDLQAARGSLAGTLQQLGDLQGARLLAEKVLEVRSRTLPDDHPDLQRARQGVALTIKALGDLYGARELFEKVLEVRSRTLPEDHPDLQMARGNLAGTLYSLGDLERARALGEKVLEVRSRTLPDDHLYLQKARQGLALTIKAQGDLQGARALEEKVLEVFSRTLPDDHPELQMARGNLAVTVKALGDLQRARTLAEKALEVRSRTLPDDHPYLQAARGNLAGTLYLLGDFQGARALGEKVLEVRSRTLPDDHPHLQKARQGLALTIKAMGDLQGARALEEKVLEVLSRTLPDDHPDLQAARGNLAFTIRALGDLAGARALGEKALEVRSRTLPDDHPHLQAARLSLADTLCSLGDLPGALALFEKVLEVRSRTLPDDHPHLQSARGHLAVTIARLGDESSTPSGEEEESLRDREERRERCADLLLARVRAQTSAARRALLESSAREAEARCARLGSGLDLALSFASGFGVFDPIPELDRASLVLGETTRGAALGSTALMRHAAGAPGCADLRESLRRQSEELAVLVSSGTTSEEFQEALAQREATQRELVELAREPSGSGAAALEFDIDALAMRLEADEAVVSFRTYERSYVEDGAVKSVASLCALVLRRGETGAGAVARSGRVDRVEIGPIDPIEAAVRSWRESIEAGVERGVGVNQEHASLTRLRGGALRRLVFDPLMPALAGTSHVVLALDDVLHLVPIGALPMDPEETLQDDRASGRASARANIELVGDRWRIETRCTLAELLTFEPEPARAIALLALGGASFNSEPLAPSTEETATLKEPAGAGAPSGSVRRGGTWQRAFEPLTYTGLEVRAVAALYEELFGTEVEDRGSAASAEPVALVLEKRKASRQALIELAPRACFLHIATHGWFAPESIRSWQDPEPLDRLTGLGFRQSGEEQVRGMSPMLLCGLALAGANLPEDAVGRAPGLITAEEIAALDLSHCELAVLSACDTARGEMRRAGQGVASLQMALQMAGARSVITSLWKVPDEATKELMLDFYRRLWVEKKPKGLALWEAKKKLRDAKDERGNPKYTTRDWAAWVLTGEPE